ncbi:MAG: DsbA family protein [Solirubrobacteraceae bacterium]
MSETVLYFDLASPYSYLAVMRVADVLGGEPELEPVLAGAIFAHRGWGSWALTEARAGNVAEIERRAQARGLPLRWPAAWPASSLEAQRAAVHAKRRGVTRRFAEAAYLATFGAGGDLSERETILAAGEEAGIAREQMRSALSDPEIKAELRATTDAAIELGVIGVPTLRLGGELYFGDDQLEQAAERLRR